VFLRASAGKIAFLREYFDPARAAKAMNTPILPSTRDAVAGGTRLADDSKGLRAVWLR
jgi:hypothetical protein